VDELARLTGLGPALTERVLVELQEVLSLDAPASREHSEAVIDHVASADPAPLEALLAKERAEYARASLAALPDREREVVELRTGDAELSLEEIGATLASERTGRLGLSRQRIGQLERDALGMLRRRAEATARAERTLRGLLRRALTA
jgi:DNA-directed RNA polymerase sigma subunit (sigma70/sigma32)